MGDEAPEEDVELAPLSVASLAGIGLTTMRVGDKIGGDWALFVVGGGGATRDGLLPSDMLMYVVGDAGTTSCFCFAVDLWVSFVSSSLPPPLSLQTPTLRWPAGELATGSPPDSSDATDLMEDLRTGGGGALPQVVGEPAPGVGEWTGDGEGGEVSGFSFSFPGLGKTGGGEVVFFILHAESTV